MSGPFAFVTLISSDSYLPGALVLAASLKDVHPSPAVAPEVDFKTVCLVTPETVDVASIKALRKAFDIVIGVEILEAENATGLKLLGRPDLNTVLTKLHVFRLTEFSKIIFLDADILPLKPISHLFLTPHEFSACPDIGWPDIFNSGLMVLEPGEDKFNELTELVKSKGSWDGADQGLLNEWRGGDWNRLSFTYNTTPSSAYTYAPAYERFGPAVRAIHFIGQHKPWASIPWRAPIEHPSAESMRSYGYSNLVDRWFAVYDRHYRPPQIATEEEYQMQHYPASWETAAFEATSYGLGLEDLKKMAVQGVLSTAPASGEGEYRSLPLEGRVDLMRPRKPDPLPSAYSEGVEQGTQGVTTFQAHNEPPAEDYRPPGREGLPSYLYRPPTPPPQIAPSTEPQQSPADTAQVASPAPHHAEPVPWWQQQPQYMHGEEHVPDFRPPSPPKLTWDPSREPPPSNPPPIIALSFTDHQYQNVWDLPPHQPLHSQHTTYQDPWAPAYVNERSSSPFYPQQEFHSPSYHVSPHHSHDSHGHQHYHQHHGDDSGFGQNHPTSPPGGDSAFRTSPAYHSFGHGSQATTYYQRHHVADHHEPYPHPHHRQDSRQGQHEGHDHFGSHYHHQHPPRREPRPEDFFQAPAPPSIPHNLVREGHYTAVTTDEPKPDIKKVEPIFPWEQRSRPPPRRVFPDWRPPPTAPPAYPAAPKPSQPPAQTTMETPPGAPKSVQEIPHGRSPSPPPPPHVKRKFNPPPSPPKRHGSIYINAWDTDTTIQRYASVLQGRSSHILPQPWPTHPGQEAQASKDRKGKERRKEEEEEEDDYTNWIERAEASSRDGDDEDDEGESPVLSPRSAARRRAAKAKGKIYCHQGVQTDTKVTESRGVQVDMYTKRPGLDTTPRRHSSTGTSPSTANPLLIKAKRTFTPPVGIIYGSPSVPPPEPTHESKSQEIGDESAYRPSEAFNARAAFVKEEADIGSPVTPMLRKRDSSEDSETTAADSSIISSPTKEVEEVGTPRVSIHGSEAVVGRLPSGSSVGPRRAMRVFSPTTGVEIFKRGSEEVLARFLMQQPPGWDTARQADPGPPTPSAIH
ncbi:related to glycogenin-2 beta [Serendipita indica DSM 11827]|uniref:glycogenin glucosyltransferase n=1 Tax=Serendipita indica (strain DSM 11827) TaxID=1109443 RepID=G4T8T7_SERID|nr:related to glycogenin-2 beta [Serendipita indica DSM 11827]